VKNTRIAGQLVGRRCTSHGSFHQSPITSHQSLSLKGKRPVFSASNSARDHVDCIPRAALQERASGPLRCRVCIRWHSRGSNDNAAERGMILVWRPIHAIRNGAVLDARAGDPAHPVQHSLMIKNVRLALALRRRCPWTSVVLHYRPCLKFLDARSASPLRSSTMGRYFLSADAELVVQSEVETFSAFLICRAEHLLVAGRAQVVSRGGA